MTTELLDKPQSAVAEYQPFYAQLAKLEEDNAALAFDYESKKGNKEARSHIHSLRLTKGALERARKEAKDESLRIGRAVDAEAAEIEARIEAMIVVHQTKIDEIEQRERDRVAALADRVDAIESHGLYAARQSEIEEAIRQLESLPIDESYQERIGDASIAKDARLAALRAALTAKKKADDEAAELARLRAEAEARAQKDRDDSIARAAEERARAEAQAAADRAAKAAAQAIADAEAKAKAEREAAERKELELKLQIEQAEIRRIQAERKAMDDAKQAAERAEQEKERAIQAEQTRVAALAKAEADAQAKREANNAHKRKINQAALAALVAGGISEECGRECIKLIASGKVPAIQINY